MKFLKRNFWIKVIFMISIFFAQNAKSNIDYNANCKKAYVFALAFHYYAMDSVLKIEEQKNPSNSVIYSIKCASSFLKYASSEDDKYFKEFKANMDIALDKLEDESDNNPYKSYIITDLYMQSTFINAVNSNYITSLIQFKKAYNTIHENQERFPKFILNKKALGVMNIAIGSIPKSYNWTLSLLNLKGNLKLGNQQLAEFMNICQTNSNYKYLFLESLVLYSFTHTNYANKKDQDNLLSNIFSDSTTSAKYVNNQLYAFIKASYYQHLKQNKNAIETLSNIQSELNRNTYKLYYLDYMYGESLLFKNDKRAKEYYSKYIANYPGKNYKKSATYKLAWAFLLDGDLMSYNTQMQKIKDVGDDFFDSDKQAEKAANNNKIPNVALLKGRLLFDGGYYHQADSLLRNSYAQGTIKSQHDNLEYIYRLARIYDGLENFKVAEIYYKMTIEKGKDYKYYFAANSALNLGYHYEQDGDFAEANKMYQLCLDLEFDEYQNGITQKAKAGLNRIEDEEE